MKIHVLVTQKMQRAEEENQTHSSKMRETFFPKFMEKSFGIHGQNMSDFLR